MLMKRFLLVAALLMAVLPSYAIIWQYGSFSASKKQCAIKGWSGSQPTSGKLNIPSSYKHTDGVTYTVVTIAPHALDNLTTVTEIHIPASIVKIGDAKLDQFPSEPENFLNCPELKKFTVDAGNKAFSAINDMLYLEGVNLLKVPAKLQVTDGALVLPSATTNISDMAFADNSTIVTLTLPRRCTISYNGGLNFAKAIKTYKVTGTGSSLAVTNKLLHNSTYLISCPPALKASKVTVPSSMDAITRYAFANTKDVAEVELIAIDRMLIGAFAGAGLKSIHIPGTVTKIEDYAFENCTELTSIELESVDLELRTHFAAGCTSLQRVTSENPIGEIGHGAFLNCRSLTEFPFSAYTDAYGDSIFYGSGLTTVKYDSEPIREFNSLTGEYMFAASRNLESIDASAIPTNPDDLFGIATNYAANCMKLTSLKLPRFTSFYEYMSPVSPAFGYYCVLDHIEAGTMWGGTNAPVFCYSTTNNTREFYPKVYVAVTTNSAIDPDYFNQWPIGTMFAAGNGASVYPQVYTDSYNPAEDYVYPGASYFVPGGTLHNYSEATKQGCKVQENYSINFEESGEELRVTIAQAPSSPAMVKNFSVSFNGEKPKTVGYQGWALSDCGYDHVMTVRVSYTVDGVAMSTDYPAEHWHGASVGDITIDPSHISLDGRTLHGGDSCTEITVHDIAGHTVVTCHGADADLTSLSAGVYIARITYTSSETRTFKFSLK